ncbi:PIN domain nuclease [Glycomyces sp. MUSA5-2]|uniref:PIN domain nuclease n=1 Tax=Glycomyces sp. MUSA5-2 TaxID=2053002 RepID=UPI003008D733
MSYLIDASAYWFLYKNPPIFERWANVIHTGLVRTCEPTRVEILYSATGPRDRDKMAERLDALFPLTPVPKKAWPWVETAQYTLTQMGQHRSAGPVDLLLCATAVQHGLMILHVDNDFRTVSSVMTEVRQRDVRN